MKKGDIVTGIVERIDFPNKGIVRLLDMEEETFATVKNALPGQKITLRISKKRQGKIEGRLLDIIEESKLSGDDSCPHAGICGGCLYQGMSYDKQLQIKEGQIRRLLSPVIGEEVFDAINEGIFASPRPEEYRNKMELSFGDDMPGGELCLGMHRRGSFYDIVTTDRCRIMDRDMRTVLLTTLTYFRKFETSYYHKRTHEGYLRHLLLRKAAKTGEILVDLVTSTQTKEKAHISLEEGIDKNQESLVGLPEDVEAEEQLLCGWKDALLAQTYEGQMTGILHTKNDRPADVIEDQGTKILYGQDYFTEDLLGLKFKITPFSFFQTNSLGAEVLYTKAREYILDQVPGKAYTNGRSLAKDMDEGDMHTDEEKEFSRVFDLYSGTGTIAQILSPAAKEIVGVEIVPEAVEAAKENAKGNGLNNCSFLCGDVLKVLDEVEVRPDMIILDPPRDGIHPKALPKILDYGVKRILYISCKPTSLARDLPAFLESGYKPERLCMVDMFPATSGVETVCLLSQRKPDTTIEVDLDISELEVSSAETKATYEEIKSYVLKKFGLKVSNLYIAQVKRECGIVERINYNLPKTEGNRVPQCPEDKRKAIKDAFIHFQMI